ncbi:protein of unknown function [Taphrina deformans PYCC 5710]|uniref:SCP domain-containing protein n=1 Tax=Taphrina deformans (strain PYCC 5710 / ATCC 11124 / CBS 356.35 / IMI 108563 / JCM 9778 / NBRC 8474) TaxID=1097556 RepID=R4XKG1_TAPDE|nr:protein of unknown function [Taphrina deformans PYCC 5710]|eukprot:CCG83809.1 protein of unknown function [Taphrina deformans PYCC 5710]
MFISSQTLFTLLVSAVSARPPLLKRQVIEWQTKQETVTDSTTVATAWQTVQQATPTSAAVLSSVQQVQVHINEISVQYTYSSARTVFAIPTVVTSTITQTVQVTEYVSNGVTVTPQATLTTTNTINAQATPIGSQVGAPVTATLPLVSARISGATVTVSAQTYTYYTPVINAVGQKVEAATTISAAQSLSAATEASIMTGAANGGLDASVSVAVPLQLPGVISTSASTTSAQTTSTTPTTSAQTTAIQTTSAQTTSALTTSALTTSVQTTSAQTTSAQTTSAPTTSSQTTSTPGTTKQTTSSTTAASQPTPIAQSNQDFFVSAVLARINGYRALHDAGALTWNYDLASAALTYAESCTMQPSTDKSSGETLAAGTATDPAFYVDLWYNEGSSYNYNAPGFSDATGHFTQLVWKATSSVGCGFSSGCGEYSNYLVCRYASPGNVLGVTNNVQFFIDNVS